MAAVGWRSGSIGVLIQFIFFSSESVDMSSSTARKTIKNYSYHLARTIGEGFSSRVFAGLDEKANAPVAIKVISKLGHSSSERLQLAHAEIRALELLKGRENILELREALQTKSAVYIVTELCSKGTVRDLLTRQRRLSENAAIGIMNQVICGYCSIHQQGLVHRDIKPDNIFLTADGDVRIGDFGFAINIQQCGQSVRENLGSPLFMSMEALADNNYSFKSDIWAMGVTFFEMLIGRVPWISKSEKELVCQIQKFDVESLLPQTMSAGCKAFLRRTLERDVNKRMSPQELFAFQFQSYNDLRPNLPSSLKNTSSLERIISKQQLKQGMLRKQEGSQTCRQERESTRQNSKPNLSQLQEEAEKAIDEKMAISLPIQSTGLPSKLSRKYSQVETVPPQPQQTVVSGKMERKVMLMIQSQINYFRFLFKLFKRIHDTLKTTDQHFTTFKQGLIYLVHAKIQQIKTLQYLPVDASARQLLKNTAEYANIVNVLGQYEMRYWRDEVKAKVRGVCIGEEQLIELLCFMLRVLSQNIMRLETSEEEFERKKSLVTIVQDILSLYHLYIIERTHDWTTFHQHSGIQHALEPLPSSLDARAHWQDLKEQIRKLVDL